MTTTSADTGPTRRERQRQATYDEIVDVARQLLRGGSEVSLRAVATEMGLTPPALYRYVDGAAALNALVTRQIFVDVVAAMAVARDEHPQDDPAAQIVAAATAFRAWALGNHAEFRMVFASPPTPGDDRHEHSFPLLAGADECAEGESLFTDFFGELFYRLWEQRHFPAPSRDQLEPGVVTRWESAGESPKADLVRLFGDDGVGVLWLFELAWARLYGIVTLEVFGHMDPQLTSSGALFRATILEIGTSLGMADDWERLRVIAGYPGDQA
ncbi:TetR/AcrR family transcriptional regulator [Nocardioides bigeumensis]|uniref:TetR/AcrR family transcriptional regulator n=1 Tax=Nocardioides bigeumensis TaxID=433657 RepID=A0ABP5JW23_9ACTN